jgi:integrase/recombinase XerC
VCNARDRAIVLAFVDTGLRLAEFVQLRRDRIDWQPDHFTVIGKGNVERSGWLSPLSCVAIRAYLDTRRDRSSALWYGRSGPLTGNGVYQVIKRRCVEAGIRGEVRRLCHAFRATFGKLYLESPGSDLESLRALYGHASIQITSYYAQLSTAQLARKKAAVNPLAALFTDES